jgi:hypothetical protein
MSGPIIRQYGVPNWDEIFGKKEDGDAKVEKRQPDAEAKTDEKPSSGDAAETSGE